MESECRGLGADHLGDLPVATGPLPCISKGGCAGERQDSIRLPFVSQRRSKLQRASRPAGMWPRAALLWSMKKARDNKNGSALLVRGCSRHAWSCELDRPSPRSRERGKTAAVGRRAGRGEADGSKPCVRPEEDNAGSWNCEGPNCPPTLNDWTGALGSTLSGVRSRQIGPTGSKLPSFSKHSRGDETLTMFSSPNMRSDRTYRTCPRMEP